MCHLNAKCVLPCLCCETATYLLLIVSVNTPAALNLLLITIITSPWFPTVKCVHLASLISGSHIPITLGEHSSVMGSAPVTPGLQRRPTTEHRGSQCPSHQHILYCFGRS